MNTFKLATAALALGALGLGATSPAVSQAHAGHGDHAEPAAPAVRPDVRAYLDAMKAAPRPHVSACARPIPAATNPRAASRAACWA